MKFGRGTSTMQRRKNKKWDAKVISQFFKSNTRQFHSTESGEFVQKKNLSLSYDMEELRVAARVTVRPNTSDYCKY